MLPELNIGRYRKLRYQLFPQHLQDRVCHVRKQAQLRTVLATDSGSARDRPGWTSVLKRQHPWPPAPNTVPSLTVVAPRNGQVNILSGQLQCIFQPPSQGIYSMLLLKGQRQGQHVQHGTHLRTQADSHWAFFALFFRRAEKNAAQRHFQASCS